MIKEPILKVSNLGISFSQYTKGLKRRDLTVISNMDLELYAGEIVAIVGSSGSGKSLLASAIFGLLPENARAEGEIYYQGMCLKQRDKEKLRGKEMVLVPQSVNYLDPLQKVGKQIAISVKNKANRAKVIENLLNKYNLASEVAEYYPFQLSGGMARKVLLATAFAADPKIIIADEPTPGLDKDSLKEVLKDFRELANSGCAILMITHDMEAALTIADKIAIFYAGTTLEISNVQDFDNQGELLRHPYTKALNRARPMIEFTPIEGTQPFADELPKGCLFSDRCSLKTEKCEKERPAFREIREGKVRCIYAT
ncbi:ABC transporter ATP-binding protein [Clostridium aminobutyricum]|uniref:Nickel import system ATP-binding protein NikD n=1 Tax=Clostridium aminobutyricum TaxID=33953 RepID=A0A939IJI8_CLOAM|nr:ABC transporter ATP-binding protein [Clostridium aminobutyricum]MBN7773624.1 ABC transporter ATP-binding protein [Clostridium aminobutyricum]